MKKAMLGALLAAGLLVVAVAWSQSPTAYPQRSPSNAQPGGDGSLIALSSPSADNATHLTVIDPRAQAIAVYRIDSVSGKLKLLSVRNIHWDLQMLRYNTENPLPEEIRSLIEQR